jgi:hypothetical protein
MQLVDDSDYKILEFLHITLAKGMCVIINPNINNEGKELPLEAQQENQYKHAVALKNWFGFSENEVIEATGIFIGENT